MFRKKRGRIRGNFEQFSWIAEPIEPRNVSKIVPCWRVGRIIGLTRFLHAKPVPLRSETLCQYNARLDSISRTNPPELLQMVITAAHVPAIVALIAGILILVMPRLLNFIVAIYLIFVGLVGMGLLRWLHL
jgi:hypothetical protein